MVENWRNKNKECLKATLGSGGDKRQIQRNMYHALQHRTACFSLPVFFKHIPTYTLLHLGFSQGTERALAQESGGKDPFSPTEFQCDSYHSFPHVMVSLICRLDTPNCSILCFKDFTALLHCRVSQAWTFLLRGGCVSAHRALTSRFFVFSLCKDYLQQQAWSWRIGSCVVLGEKRRKRDLVRKDKTEGKVEGMKS